MTRGHRSALLAVAALAVILMAGGAALAQEQVTYTWTAPTTGSPVDHYVVQHSVDGGAWVTVATDVTETTYVLSAEYDHQHQIRVAGVDAQGRQGPFSEPSDPYTPTLGAPGQPGKPVAVF